MSVQESQDATPNVLVNGPKFLTLFGDEASIAQDLARLAKGGAEALWAFFARMKCCRVHAWA